MVETQQATDEIVLNVPLRDARVVSRTRKADTAIEELRRFIARHTRTERGKIWIDNKVNEKVWERGKKKVPGKLTVKVVKLQDGTVEVIMP
ncbi:50S ribosomal protein L31e [Thermogymnomonas acidicola]|uniref:Large ribosomal subunit protein eL31 n=1 Tax=Thermogymnomonas acidicola TaxID=399579 RepID=A0AA37BPV8_9ARCH|nr:50S ribosomal protein L31e [Thermogymnomonas acidicola]GGM67161.1 50S ribosomal protein L31e [Thermogymnomonas acidicola]